MSIASVIEFHELCNVFEKITKLKTQQQKFNELEKFFTHCKRKIDELKVTNPNVDPTLFPILRLILPALERERGPYGLKIKTLTELYLRIFCIGKKTREAQKLINYREPTNNIEKESGYAEAVYFVLHRRLPGHTSKFTIEDVNRFLDDVAQKNNQNQKKDDTFRNFILKLSALELKWITKIILKEMKLGMTQKKIFQAFHEDAENLYNVQSSLKEICKKLTDKRRISDGIRNEIQLFSHFKPMLLERCKIEETGRFFQLDEKRYFVQTKHDGERSQIHIKDGVFKYFTRQGYDISSKPLYGITPSDGFMSRNISSLLNKDCNSVILDGELMGYHKTKKKFSTKGDNIDVKNFKDTSAHQPCFIAFDIILYNDQLLVDKPYHERLTIMQKAFTEKEGVLMKSQTCTISSSKELIELFNQSLDNDDEGIVLKKYDSVYKPNVRERSGCYKIKAEYSDNLVSDIDAIILGGYYGEGKWTGMCNSFLVGIASSHLLGDQTPMTFLALVSVGTGFNHNSLKELNQRFKNQWKKKCPINVIGPKTGLPNLWLDPVDSIIVKLKATEIIKSKDYPFGYTLRFPRVVQIRDDKPWHGACSTDEFSNLIKNSDMIQKLTKRHATEDDINKVIPEKKAKKSSTRGGSKIDDSFLGVNPNDVVRLTRLFNNKEICVINGDDEITKTEIERTLIQHMAKIVQNPRTDTFCVVVANPKSWKVKNIIQSRNYDVVSLEWLKRVTRRENWPRLQDFQPWELLSTKMSTKKRLSAAFDFFYDSYNVDATVESLKRTFEKAEEFIENEAQPINMKDLDNTIFDGVSPFSIFREIKVHFHELVTVERRVFQFFNGTVVDNLKDATYFVVKKNSPFSFPDDNLSSAVTLSSDWINDCFKHRTLLSHDNYILR